MSEAECSRSSWQRISSPPPQAVTAARAVCSSCPVQFPCRRYAYAVNPYGVYAGETQTERTANLKLHAGLAADEHRPHGEVVA